MPSCDHIGNCSRNSDRKFDFSGIPVLTTPSCPMTLLLRPRPQLALSHRRNGVQRQYLCVAGLLWFGCVEINDSIEYKKVANELLSCLPQGLQNNVMVRAPFAADHQISFGIKDCGGWDSCRAFQLAIERCHQPCHPVLPLSHALHLQGGRHLRSRRPENTA